MVESHVVSALVNKRAEIAGMFARTEQQLGQFRADLVHLDATLRLFVSGSRSPRRVRPENLASRSLGRARRTVAPRARRASPGG